jgi:hypothetical protein
VIKKTDGQDMRHVRKERRGVYRALVEIPEGDDLEDPSVDGRIILKSIFEY